MKYYATDVGIRNALFNFRQIEETHLMENVIYNELVLRGYAVDVGAIRVTETRDGKRNDSMREIDFVVNRGTSGPISSQRGALTTSASGSRRSRRCSRAATSFGNTWWSTARRSPGPTNAASPTWA